jgi:hypothetical protein
MRYSTCLGKEIVWIEEQVGMPFPIVIRHSREWCQGVYVCKEN